KPCAITASASSPWAARTCRYCSSAACSRSSLRRRPMAPQRTAQPPPVRGVRARRPRDRRYAAHAMTRAPLPHESVPVETVSALLDLVVADEASGASIHQALAEADLDHEAGARLALQTAQCRASFRHSHRRDQELSA